MEEPLSIPEPLRLLAECCLAYGPEPPPGSGRERLLTDRYCVFFAPSASMTAVERVRVEPEQVEATVEEVRALLRKRGRTRTAWSLGPSSRPADLEARLRALGMTPYEEPPLEPRYRAMVLARPPAGDSVEGVETRVAASEEDVVAGAEVATAAFGMAGSERAQFVESAVTSWRAAEGAENYPYRTYVAGVDGEIVGVALATLAAHAVQLTGGAVLPAARGRGVYRALLETRWRDAVARGTPALTVEAGQMSAPILERLGFVTVAELTMLCDRFPAAG